MGRDLNILARKLGFIAGMTALMMLYFWAHNVGEQPAMLALAFSRIAGAGLDVGVMIVLFGLAGGIGRAVLRRAGVDGFSRAETASISAGIGLGIISAGVLLAGMAGLFNALLWVPVLLAAVLLGRDVAGWLRDIWGVLGRVLAVEAEFGRFAVVFCAVMLGTAILFALAPPFKWDAMTYHLVIPARYIAEGRIGTHLDIHFMGFPQAVEMLSGLAILATGRDTGAAVIHAAFGVLGLLALGGLLRRYVDATTAAVGGLLIFSSVGVWVQFGVPYVDLVMLAYGAMMFSTANVWRATGADRYLLLLGALAGFALGVKYTAGAMVIAVGVFLLVRGTGDLLRRIRAGVLLGMAAAAAFAPWMLKGLLLYENPVYPYFFGGPNWDSFRSAMFNATETGLLESAYPWHLAILPLAATIFGIEDVMPYAFTLGPWLIGLAFGLPLVWCYLPGRVRELALDALALAIPLWAFWVVMAATSGIGAQSRLMMIGFSVVAALGALTYYGLKQMPREPLNVAFIVQGLLIFTLLLGGIEIANRVVRGGVGPYLVGRMNTEEYLLRNLGLHYQMMRELDALEPGATVMFLWEPKIYYCPEHLTCVPDTIFDNWGRPIVREGLTPDELMARWRADGVDYLLVYGMETDGLLVGYEIWLDYARLTREAALLFPDALERHTRPFWTDGIAHTLYTWDD